ncbi:MAG: response regulator [Chloroflexota bacterium]
MANSHPAALEAIKNLLVDGFCVVQTVRSGELALQAARDFPPDIILLDTAFADMTGFEVCRQLKAGERALAIPVLFLVDPEQPEEISKVFQVGGSDIIARPVSREELLARLAMHLASQRLKVELETERSEKARLEQEAQQWKQTLEEQVKQRTQELETALANERAGREQAIIAARMTAMSKMAALIVRDLTYPLSAMQQDLIDISVLVQENPGAAQALERSRANLEHLAKVVTELHQICVL